MAEDVTHDVALMSDDEIGEYLQKGELTLEEAMGFHPLARMFANTFIRLGGEEYLYEFGQENPRAFLSFLLKQTPSLQPTSSQSGDVHLHVHQSLGKTALDE